MVNNTATDSAGALHSLAAIFSLCSGNHQLIINQAAHSGGAVYSIESTVHIYSQFLLAASNLATDMHGRSSIHIQN